MNDYGAFQAIENAINGDGVLNQKITAIVTTIKPEMKMPYVFVNFTKSEVDLMCAVNSALVTCELSIPSDYGGDFELQSIVARLDWLLQARTHHVHPQGRNGRAVFKFKGIKKDYDPQTKCNRATLSYQIRIIMER